MNGTSAAPPAGPGNSALQLLIVDDELGVRTSMRRVLERAGYRVRLAASAEEALSELRAGQVDLLITDMIMPQLNGAELIAIVKREFPAVRIVGISGGGNFWPQGYKPDAITTSAYLAAAKKAGADDVIAKPFEMLELIEVVTRVLGATGRRD